MIKINLNKTRTTVDSQTALSRGKKTRGSTILTEFQSALENRLREASPLFFIKILINIILIASFPLGLKIYEVKQINQLEAQKQKEENLLSQSKQRLSALKKELDSYGYLKDKLREFQKKKEFLSQLTEKRLVVPTILDFIQNKLPDTVWLKRIQVDISKEESKEVQISGESFKEVGVNIFAGLLEEMLDSNSITVNMRDIKEGSNVLKVSFDLKGEM